MCGVIQHCYRKVLDDFKTEGNKTPKFLMATGISDLTRNGRVGSVLPSRSVLYVADVASGMANAYAVPYNSTQHLSGQFIEAPLVQACTFPIRKVVTTGGKKGKGG